MIALSVLLGLLSFFLVARPRVSMMAGEMLTKNDPFSTPFTEKNDGQFSIYDVTTDCRIREIGTHAIALRVAPSRGKDGEAGAEFDLLPRVPSVPVLEPGETTTRTLKAPVILKAPVEDADIELIVRFRPRFWPGRMVDRFRYATRPDAAGVLHWYAKSDSEPDPAPH